MEAFYIYCLFGIISGIVIALTLLFIVLDKDFKGYTRQAPMPPSYLKPKKCQEQKNIRIQKQKQ